MLRAFEKSDPFFISSLREVISTSFDGPVKLYTAYIWSTPEHRYFLYKAIVYARNDFEAKFLLFEHSLDDRWITSSTVEENVITPRVLSMCNEDN